MEHLLLLFFTVVVGCSLVFFIFKRKEVEKKSSCVSSESIQKSVPTKLSVKAKTKKVDITAKSPGSRANHVSVSESNLQSHPLYFHSLKGHQSTIKDACISPNGQLIAICSGDRSIRIHFMETLSDRNPKYHRINIEFDHATSLAWSSDGKLLAASTENGLIKLYHNFHSKPELLNEFPTNHEGTIRSLLLIDIGKWTTVVSCADEEDTELKLWDIQGKCLQILNTNQVNNYRLVGSCDNRYFAVASYMPDVKIFEIHREKNGAFKKAERAMTLQGHKSGVTSVDFNGSDNHPVSQMLTASKDGQMCIWDICVRYTLQEDPKLIRTCPLPDGYVYEQAAFSPNGKLLAASYGSTLHFLNSSTFELIDSVQHPETIHRISFIPKAQAVLVYSLNLKYAIIYRIPPKKGQ